MRRLREGVLLSKDVHLGVARKNAQLVARLRSQAELPGRSCAPDASPGAAARAGTGFTSGGRLPTACPDASLAAFLGNFGLLCRPAEFPALRASALSEPGSLAVGAFAAFFATRLF